MQYSKTSVLYWRETWRGDTFGCQSLAVHKLGFDASNFESTARTSPQAKKPVSVNMNSSEAATAPTVAVIIVTYNSGKVLPRCLEALTAQTRTVESIIVIDNNSPDSSYLDSIRPPVTLVRNNSNDGFCGGNNIGYTLNGAYKYVLFLNPDAYLEREFIEKAIQWMERADNLRIGALTGTLLGFDLQQCRPTGRIDSTGIFQTWYGKWYDRRQGSAWTGNHSGIESENVPAICGALMFCRAKALEDVKLANGDIFDSRFFMYKEDIDLSLRLRRKGWRLEYVPQLLSYHCRGWKSRREMPARSKYLSARNELRVCFRHRTIGLPYSLLKYAYAVVGYTLFRMLRLLKGSTKT